MFKLPAGVAEDTEHSPLQPSHSIAARLMSILSPKGDKDIDDDEEEELEDEEEDIGDEDIYDADEDDDDEHQYPANWKESAPPEKAVQVESWQDDSNGLGKQSEPVLYGYQHDPAIPGAGADLPGSIKDEAQSSESGKAAPDAGEAAHVKPHRTGGLKQKSFFTPDDYKFEEESQPSRHFKAHELAQSSKDKEIPPSCTIKIPDISTHEYEDIIHAVVWHVGRIFGFQAFNVNPQTQKQVSKEYVPATIFLATDHIVKLLLHNGFVRREQGKDTQEERFARALYEFHCTIFKSYEENYLPLVGLSRRTGYAEAMLQTRPYASTRCTHGLLCELALYFLLYSEASSLRHTPELLWFLYWTLNHSPNMSELWQHDLPHANEELRTKHLELRNMHQSVILDVQNALHLHPKRMRPEDCGRVSSILAKLKNVIMSTEEKYIVAELIAFGDGGFFCDRIVTPIFYVMSYEIDHLSNLGVDVAHRIGYDDFNESLCNRDIVHDTLAALKVTRQDLSEQHPNEAYHSMTNLGFTKQSKAFFDPQVASDFWRTKVFVKTYRERRSWAALYRAFYRVVAFHLVLFHMIQTFAFVGLDWRMLSSGIITMAWCKALERICNWFMTQEPDEPLSTTLSKLFSSKNKNKLNSNNMRAALNFESNKEGREFARSGDTRNQAYAYTFAAERFNERRKHDVEGKPVNIFWGLLFWILLAMIATSWFVAQFIYGPIKDWCYNWWWVFVTVYCGVHVIHFLTTTRDGYVVSFMTMIGAPKWMRGHGTVPDPTCWLYYPQGTKFKLFFYDVWFWIIVMGMKIPFDYYIVCKPNVVPVQAVFGRGWLGCDARLWTHAYWGAPCIGGDWILAVARICPYILIFFMDTALFYQITTTIYGILVGMLKIDLGVLSGWDDVVNEFYRAPARWWHRCMSEMGNANRLASLKLALFTVDKGDSSDEEDGHKRFASAVVTDGLMFKKAVLSPEELKAQASQRNLSKPGTGKSASKAGTSRAMSKAVSRMGSQADLGSQPTEFWRSPKGTENGAPGKNRTSLLKNAVANASRGNKVAPAPPGLGLTTMKEMEAAVAAKLRNMAKASQRFGDDEDGIASPQARTVPGLIKAHDADKEEGETSAMSEDSLSVLTPIGLIKETSRRWAGSIGLMPSKKELNRESSKKIMSSEDTMTEQFQRVQAARLKKEEERKRKEEIERKKEEVLQKKEEALRKKESAIQRREEGEDSGNSEHLQPQPTSRALNAEASTATPEIQNQLRPFMSMGRFHAHAEEEEEEEEEEGGNSEHLRESGTPKTGKVGGAFGTLKRFLTTNRKSNHRSSTDTGDAGMAIGEATEEIDVEEGLQPLSQHEQMQERSDGHAPQQQSAAVTSGAPRSNSLSSSRGISSFIYRRGGEIEEAGEVLPDVAEETGPADREETEHYEPLHVESTRPKLQQEIDEVFGSPVGSVMQANAVSPFQALSDQGKEEEVDSNKTSGSAALRELRESSTTHSQTRSGRLSSWMDARPTRASPTIKTPAALADTQPQVQPAALTSHLLAGDKGQQLVEEASESYSPAEFVGSASPLSAVEGLAEPGHVLGRSPVHVMVSISQPHSSSSGGGSQARSSSSRYSGKDMGKGAHPAISEPPAVKARAVGFLEKLKSAGNSFTSNALSASVTSSGSGSAGRGSSKCSEKARLKSLLEVDERRVSSMTMMGLDDETYKPEEDELDDVMYQMMMWTAFAGAWDDIVDDLRASDVICDKEVSMLKFVRLDLGSNLHGLRPLLLPTFFYAGQIRKVVDTGSVSTAQVMVLNELRMLCVWVGCQIGLLSGKHAHVITSTPFIASIVNVKHALHRKKFYTSGIKLTELLENMCTLQQVPFDMHDFAEHLLIIFTGLEGEAYAIIKSCKDKKGKEEDLQLANILIEVAQELKKGIKNDPDHLKVMFKRALENSATATFKELARVIRVLKRMLVATQSEATPSSEEGQRILSFFINSLGHPNLDKPPSVDQMYSHSILTPLYEEDVLYPLQAEALAKELGLKKKNMTDLLTESEDSVSLIVFLKAMFTNDWNNFKERIKNMVPEIKLDEMTETDFAPGEKLYDLRLELMMWASTRGQLLARTVNGMMKTEKALRLLIAMEHPRPPTMSEDEYRNWMERLISYKFEYVVTPQTYGKNRSSADMRMRWLAQSIDTLLQRYPRLKAAFLDMGVTENGPTQFSVCIKGVHPDPLMPLPSHVDEGAQVVYELYRIRLPINRYSGRGVILGEGKPENQNHATIFAHGEALQAIDMNQDHYLSETLKVRNLLTELQPSTPGKFHLFADDDEEAGFVATTATLAVEMLQHIRRQQMASVETGLVGFREYIFSEAAGALGKFAAATEYAFGTISQRIMTWPARIRLHYGHPDVFNKMFTISRGGISAATRLLHLTEDVFCGCRIILRGGKIRYKEYIYCGKGRDMGFDSINGFNFKVAGGGGEWGISRESYRIGARLDWFRLMTYYHSGVGFYVNSWVTYQVVFYNLWTLLLLEWTSAVNVGGTSVYNVQQVLQLGTLALIPYAGQLMLEWGVVKTFLTLFEQIMTGSLMFYMFQQMTVAASFQHDMSYGSGKYVGTGRGFNINTMEFVKVFTLYARTHLYAGFEIIFILSMLYILKEPSTDLSLMTWSSWLLAFTLLVAPLWFNPFTFEMEKVQKNYIAWQQWMNGDIDFITGSNWHTWNAASLEKIRNDNGNNTDNWMNILAIFLSGWPYALMALGAVSRLNIRANIFTPQSAMANPFVVFFIGTGAMFLLIMVTLFLHERWMAMANNKPWRIYKWAMSLMLIGFNFGFLLGLTAYYTGDGITTMLIIQYANFNLLIFFHRVATAMFSQVNSIRAFVDHGYYIMDSFVGYVMFIIIALLSFLGVPGILQMRLLFNDSFSKMANYGKIAKAMREAKIGYTPGAQPMPGLATRPNSADTTATRGFDVKTMVKSEHRYT